MELERIRHFADVSIRRGCGFAILAIWSAMMGMSVDMVIAAKSGALLVTLMGVVLLAKSFRAPAKSYRRTEVWILLDKRHDLPETRAQAVIGSIMREHYLWHAQVVAGIALALWLTALALLLLR